VLCEWRYRKGICAFRTRWFARGDQAQCTRFQPGFPGSHRVDMQLALSLERRFLVARLLRQLDIIETWNGAKLWVDRHCSQVLRADVAIVAALIGARQPESTPRPAVDFGTGALARSLKHHFVFSAARRPLAPSSNFALCC